MRFQSFNVLQETEEFRRSSHGYANKTLERAAEFLLRISHDLWPVWRRSSSICVLHHRGPSVTESISGQNVDEENSQADVEQDHHADHDGVWALHF